MLPIISHPSILALIEELQQYWPAAAVDSLLSDLAELADCEEL